MFWTQVTHAGVELLSRGTGTTTAAGKSTAQVLDSGGEVGENYTDITQMSAAALARMRGRVCDHWSRTLGWPGDSSERVPAQVSPAIGPGFGIETGRSGQCMRRMRNDARESRCNEERR